MDNKEEEELNSFSPGLHTDKTEKKKKENVTCHFSNCLLLRHGLSGKRSLIR